MKRQGIVRPWDRKRLGGSSKRSRSTTSSAGSDSPAREVPHVNVQGTRFYSDRFYLHRTVYDAETSSSSSSTWSTTSSSTSSKPSCQCGAHQPPPLLDREALVASLDLEMAIFATYTLDTEWMSTAFPSLFGADTKVPTLVLHGRVKSPKDDEKDGDDAQSREGSPRHGGGASLEGSSPDSPGADEDNVSIGTQPEATLHEAASFQWPSPTAAAPQRTPRRSPSVAALPKHVHFSQVAPTWLPPPDLTDIVTRTKVARERKRGVYHPKFMLLVERSGGLVVMVSTSNLTSPRATDASWVQRFPPQTTKTVHDFGAVWKDFLDKQGQACDPASLTPAAFWKRFDRHKRSIDYSWDFSQAQVELIPHVPGDYTGEDTFKYGRQRVGQILKRQASTLPPLSVADRLVMQPTSLGADWNPTNLSKVVGTYLPTRDEEDDSASRLKRLDIIWPTDGLMQQLMRSSVSPHSTLADLNWVDSQESKKAVPLSRGQQGYIFLSSESFNRIHTDCLARMVQFEPTTQRQHPLVPHFKSIARLLDRRPRGIGEGFAWFMLTSACLSRGAQGDTLPNGSVSYSNFELGVLFCSRQEGNRETDRLYCYQPTTCTCQKTKTNHRLVHLPLPFHCRPSRYVDIADDEEDDDDEVLDFVVTPYFHEIPPGTAAVGNMQLTPYGRAARAQQED
jgi:hypothetical protein